MRLTRRLADAARRPARLVAFARRAGEVLLRGELGSVLSRLRPRGFTPAQYRAWRARQPVSTGTGEPFILLLDVAETSDANAMRARIGALAAQAHATLVRDPRGGWCAVDGGGPRSLRAWAATTGCEWFWWVRQSVFFEADAARAIGLGCRVPSARVIYTDHDRVDAAGRPVYPVFKPAFDIVQARDGRLAGPCVVVHSSLAERIDALTSDALLLEVAEHEGAEAIVHVPHVCMHVDGAPARAVAPRIESASRHAVSVVVATRDRPRLLAACLRSVIACRGTHDVEVVVVDNDSVDPAVARAISAAQIKIRTTIVAAPGPFNFSRLCNVGVAAAQGDVIVLLNNDALASEGWLDELASLALAPPIGAVGPLVSYPDGRLQSAGVLVGVNRTATSALAGFAKNDPVAREWCSSRRRVSAVMGACLVVARDKYDAVGGFDEQFAVSHNEVDFCLRLEAAGWANVFTPFANVVHAEGATRGFEVTAGERSRLSDEEERFRARWGHLLDDCDPAYHPAYARRGATFALADVPAPAPPRAGWRGPAARPHGDGGANG